MKDSPGQDATNGNNTEDGSGKTETGGWADSAADSIADWTNKIREKITSPLKAAAKFFVYIPLAFLFLTASVAFVVVAALRLVDNYLSQPTWLAHFILGGVFLIIGAVLWAKRPRLRKQQQ